MAVGSVVGTTEMGPGTYRVSVTGWWNRKLRFSLSDGSEVYFTTPPSREPWTWEFSLAKPASVGIHGQISPEEPFDTLRWEYELLEHQHSWQENLYTHEWVCMSCPATVTAEQMAAAGYEPIRSEQELDDEIEWDKWEEWENADQFSNKPSDFDGLGPAPGNPAYEFSWEQKPLGAKFTPVEPDWSSIRDYFDSKEKELKEYREKNK